MSEIKQLESRLKSVIDSRCNTIGCRKCDLSWDDGCSATDLQSKIMEIEMGKPTPKPEESSE